MCSYNYCIVYCLSWLYVCIVLYWLGVFRAVCYVIRGVFHCYCWDLQGVFLVHDVFRGMVYSVRMVYSVQFKGVILLFYLAVIRKLLASTVLLTGFPLPICLTLLWDHTDASRALTLLWDHTDASRALTLLWDHTDTSRVLINYLNQIGCLCFRAGYSIISPLLYVIITS